MGKVELCMNEEGALKGVQHYDLRVPFKRPEGFERHRAVNWPSCRRLRRRSAPDAKFNRVLVFCFFLILGWTVVSIFIFKQLLKQRPYGSPAWAHALNRMWLFGYFPIVQSGIVPLVAFAALLAVGVLATRVVRDAGSAAPERKTEVQRASSMVLHI